jgi:hypothetical protein
MNDDDLDGVGGFLQSLNNYQSLWAAENSVVTPNTSGMSKNQAKKALTKHNHQVRGVVGQEINSLFQDGSVSPGDVRHTYQSSHDTGDDFGAEVGLNGVWGDEYVLHSHLNGDGTAKPGSVGLKHGSDPMGQRIAHGIDDGLAGDRSALLSHWTN